MFGFKLTRRKAINALGAALLAISLGFANTSHAAADTPEDFVLKLGQEALSTLEDANGDKSVISSSIRKWLNKYFDKSSIARFAMGRNWRNLDDAQKTAYENVFEEMIVLTYSQRLAQYSGEDFKVLGQTVVNSRDTLVHTQIIPSDSKGPKTAVDWRVRGQDAKMKIVDVLVEGVSMSITQRSDFDASIQRNNGDIDKFIADLKAKTGSK